MVTTGLVSLTKVTATTSAVAQFYQRGELDLDMPLASSYLLGSRYAVNGKSTITSRNCLLHNAGYPPDPVPGYSDPAVRQKRGVWGVYNGITWACYSLVALLHRRTIPRKHSVAMKRFSQGMWRQVILLVSWESCRLFSLLAQTLINPVGSIYVYSDLSMITMQFVVGTLAKNLGYVTPSMLLPGCENAGEGTVPNITWYNCS